jgi:hypothetical protein
MDDSATTKINPPLKTKHMTIMAGKPKLKNA